MKLYQVDVTIAATAYIKAESETDAIRKARQLIGGTLEVQDGKYDGVEVSGLSYDNPELPDTSLSPAMTIVSVSDDSVEQFDV